MLDCRDHLEATRGSLAAWGPERERDGEKMPRLRSEKVAPSAQWPGEQVRTLAYFARRPSPGPSRGVGVPLPLSRATPLRFWRRCVLSSLLRLLHSPQNHKLGPRSAAANPKLTTSLASPADVLGGGGDFASDQLPALSHGKNKKEKKIQR